MRTAGTPCSNINITTEHKPRPLGRHIDLDKSNQTKKERPTKTEIPETPAKSDGYNKLIHIGLETQDRRRSNTGNTKIIATIPNHTKPRLTTNMPQHASPSGTHTHIYLTPESSSNLESILSEIVIYYMPGNLHAASNRYQYLR